MSGINMYNRKEFIYNRHMMMVLSHRLHRIYVKPPPSSSVREGMGGGGG
jgi:hypothetical protein